MKAVLIQPPYSRDCSFSEEYFQYKLERLKEIPEADIVVLPEYSDVPCATTTLEETLYYHQKFIEPLLAACVETAKRLHAMVFVNALSLEESGYRNTTYCYDRQGVLRGKYFKKHLPPLEMDALKLDSAYTMEPSAPYVLEMEGLRFGFLTCYDFYFYESFARIAREKVDVIIGCSLQRSDTHEAIEIICRFLAYHTNAHVLRSSVSFAEDSTVCGATMAVDPRGKVLANMKGRFGSVAVDFDPADKYYKPAGYGNPDAPHYEYLEYGRKPRQYRLGGASVSLGDAWLPYPRLCAHRGMHTVAPENSLPAFGAAVAMGASEIELDLWPTKDGEFVSVHDRTLERVSNGQGKVTEHTLQELLELDFGSSYSPDLKGLQIVRFEELLQRLAGQTVMNLHVKPLHLEEPYPQELVEKLVNLVRQYDCTRHVYFMLETDTHIMQFRAAAPEIPVCVGHLQARPWEIVDRAIALGAQKVQLFKPYFNEEMIRKAHDHGIRCNVFWADHPEEAKKYLEMGVDCILTNRYQHLKQELGIQ